MVVRHGAALMFPLLQVCVYGREETFKVDFLVFRV